jgi:putative spermidine/putrescine transport system substrate-binding protein
MEGGNMHRFMRAAAVFGVLVLVAAACSTKNTGTPASTLPTTIGPTEGALNLIAWQGYTEKGWVTPFETETGCKVKIHYSDTSDDMVTQMRQGGGTQYDGVSASGDASNRLISAGNVAEINPAMFDFSAVMDLLKAPKHTTVNGKHYGVPYMWGGNLLMYNKNVVKPAPTSWSITWETNSPYKKKIVAYDSPIFIADAALYLKAHKPDLGITNPYELTSAQLDAAIALLAQQHPMVAKYWALASDEIDGFNNGSLVVGTSWPYNYNQLLSAPKAPPVAAIIPSEGATGWADTWMMSSHATHPNCMLKWMQYTLRANVQAKVAEFYGASPSITTACPILVGLVGAKTADEADHCADPNVLSQLALWQTPVANCGDSRGTVCVDYSTWTTRWQTVRGA